MEFEQLSLEDVFGWRSVEDTDRKVSSTQIGVVEDSSIVEDTDRKVSSTEIGVVEDTAIKASISTYKPNNRQTSYYRLVYRDGTKVKAIHVKGGNSRSSIAILRTERLQAMIDQGASIKELLAVINSY